MGLMRSSVEGAIRKVVVNLFCDFFFLPRSLWGVQPEHKAYYQLNFCIMLCFPAALVKGVLKHFLIFYFFFLVQGCCTALIHLFILNLWKLVPFQLLVADPPADSCASCEHTGWYFCLVAHASCGNPSFLIYGAILPLPRGILSCLSSGNKRHIAMPAKFSTNSYLIVFSRDGYGHEAQHFHLVEVHGFLGGWDGRCAFCPDSGPQHVHKTISVPKQGEKETWGPSLLHVLTYSYSIL